MVWYGIRMGAVHLDLQSCEDPKLQEAVSKLIAAGIIRTG